MRFFYSCLMYLLIPYFLIRLWWKGRRLPAYRQRIGERFCWPTTQNAPVDIWIHAVSLGEVIAATPLIDLMLAKKWSVLVTTMTPTGSERVQARFGQQVTHQYLPYDLPSVLKRFFKQRKPRLGLIMETELWPNLIYAASAAKIPLLLANARLSERSFNGYKRFRFIFKPLLNRFSVILTQSQADAERFKALGARDASVRVLGNVKFDMQMDLTNNDEIGQLKNRYANNRIVLIAASTHEGEEEAILAVLRRLQEVIPQILLFIAPRHPERFAEVYKLSTQMGFHTGLRSLIETMTNENEVLILDSLGELPAWYQASDYAFVGGSLVALGGHNVLEPIAVNIPVLSGKHVQNFKAICADLESAQAIRLVSTAEELIDAIVQLHHNESLRKKMVANAATVLEKNKGAVKKHLELIERVLKGVE